jgi:hypothetical protein
MTACTHCFIHFNMMLLSLHHEPYDVFVGLGISFYSSLSDL